MTVTRSGRRDLQVEAPSTGRGGRPCRTPTAMRRTRWCRASGRSGDPAGDVPGRPFGGDQVGHRRPAAADRSGERLEVQLTRHGHDADGQRAVDARHQRLEDPPRVDAQGLGGLEPVGLGARIVDVLVQRVGDAGSRQGDGRGRAAGWLRPLGHWALCALLLVVTADSRLAQLGDQRVRATGGRQRRDDVHGAQLGAQQVGEQDQPVGGVLGLQQRLALDIGSGATAASVQDRYVASRAAPRVGRCAGPRGRPGRRVNAARARSRISSGTGAMRPVHDMADREGAGGVEALERTARCRPRPRRTCRRGGSRSR